MRHTDHQRLKRRNITSMLFCAVLCAAMFIACDPQQAEQTGSLHLSIASSARYQSRNINPNGTAPLTIATYSVSGEGPQGKVLATVVTDHPDLTINGLLVGNWTFHVTAYNAAGKPLVTGTVDTYVTASSNSVDMTMDEAVGTGTMQISYTWNTDQTSPGATLSISMEDPAGTVTQHSPTSVDEATGTASFNLSLAAGFHTLRTLLQSGADILSGKAETIRIIEGTVSSGIIALDIGGEVDAFTLTIINNTLAPIQGSIACLPVSPVKGGTATLTYTPTLPAGILATDLSSQWYFEGQPIAGATTFILPIQTVLAGTHRYDIVIRHPLQGSIGSTGALIAVPSTAIVVTPITL